MIVWFKLQAIQAHQAVAHVQSLRGTAMLGRLAVQLMLCGRRLLVIVRGIDALLAAAAPLGRSRRAAMYSSVAMSVRGHLIALNGHVQRHLAALSGSPSR